MKKVSAIIALLMIVTMVSYASAQVAYSDSPYTSYTVVNLSSTDSANITVVYYDQNGNAAAYSPNFPNVPPGSSKTIQQALESSLPSGQYSAVITSNTPIAAIANQQLGVAGSGTSIPPFSSYSGATQGATTVLLPGIQYNWYGYYTEIYVQNAGSQPATNITISYSPTSIGSCVTGKTGSDTVASGGTPLPLYTTKKVSQFAKSELGASGLTNPCTSFNGRFFGSAVVTADQPVVVVVNSIIQNKLFTFNGFANSGTKLVAPTIMRNWYGYYTSLTIQNTSPSQDANVKLTYTSSSGSTPANKTIIANFTVPAGKSFNRYDGPSSSPAQSDLYTDYPYNTANRFFGSVIIESTNDVPIIASVNQETSKQAGTYNVFTSGEGTNKVSAPLIQAAFYGYYTSLTIMSVDGTSADVTITYTSDNDFSSKKGATKSYPHSGAFINVYEGPTASASQSDILDDAFWYSGGDHKFIGSAVIESNKPIVAFVNEESQTAPYASTRDTMYTYNAFNLQP